jgi:hypothetical protein
MPFLRSLRKGANLLDLFKAYPQTSEPLVQFHEVLMRGPSPFTEGERELINRVRIGPQSLPLLPRRSCSHGGPPGCAKKRDPERAG